MAPATEECSPAVRAAPEAAEDTADDVAAATPDPSCCRCCACWQRRKRSPPSRGTDKVGSANNQQTLLSGGKTRFYCCESKMTNKPGRAPPGRGSEARPETATAVNPGLCSMFKVRRKNSDIDEVRVSPVEFAFDAFDERAYLEEFEEIHQEEYDVTRTIVNPVR